MNRLVMTKGMMPRRKGQPSMVASAVSISPAYRVPVDQRVSSWLYHQATKSAPSHTALAQVGRRLSSDVRLRSSSAALRYTPVPKITQRMGPSTSASRRRAYGI
jgi:hypothetical protein